MCFVNKTKLLKSVFVFIHKTKNLLIAGKRHGIIRKVFLDELKLRPDTSLPSAIAVSGFPLYLTELMKDFPKNVKDQLEEEILRLVFAAKRKISDGKV